MNIGIYLDTSSFKYKNIQKIYLSNPGIGGTEYSFLLLIYYLSQKNQYSCNIYVNELFDLDFKINMIQVDNYYDAVKTSSLADDVLIIRAYEDKKLYQLIDKKKHRTITWGHNFYYHALAQMIADTRFIIRNVFVSREMYDRYIDHSIINKSTFIYNMIPKPGTNREPEVSKNPKVTYIGSLVPQKGFHILAKIWPKLLNKIPNAQLDIIGSGHLYGDQTLGSLGVADQLYESQFLKYLIDENGNLLDNITFHGLMGQEKIDIIKRTTVGVVNPTGKTETFGISACDFSSIGVPVVTKKTFGFLETVIHNKTGLLFKREKSFLKYLIKLLNNNKLNHSYGLNGIEHMKMFQPNVILEDWVDILEDSQADSNSIFITPNKNRYSQLKWLRIMNRKLKKIKWLKFLPAIVSIESFFALKILKKRLK